LTLTEKYSVVESYRHRISTIEFWDNGIVFIKIDDNSEIDLDDSIKQVNLLRSKFDGIKKYLVLADPGSYSTLSKEAREFSERPESNEMTKATAVLTSSLAQRIVVNFIISIIQKQTMKLRAFDNKDKAIEWLLTFNKK
jgi:hypothetical protein